MKLKLAELGFLRYIVFDQQRTSEGQRICQKDLYRVLEEELKP